MGRPHAGTYLVCFEAHCSRSMGAQRALQRPPSAHNILGALLRSAYCHNNKTVCSVYGRSGPACSCLSGTAGRVLALWNGLGF